MNLVEPKLDALIVTECPLSKVSFTSSIFKLKRLTRLHFLLSQANIKKLFQMRNLPVESIFFYCKTINIANSIAVKMPMTISNKTKFINIFF
jgi:hypothetical protein